MKYCPNCGTELKEVQDVCLNCGRLLHQSSGEKNTSTVDDTGNGAWGVLGFFVPVAGLILYLLWNTSAPKNAKMAGKGALISVIVSASFAVLAFVAYIIILFSVGVMY